MKRNERIARIIGIGIGLTSLLTGCSLSPKETVARNTTEFNLVAEKTGNEMLLLNIVRASHAGPCTSRRSSS